MSQSIDANLKATVTVATDFTEAKQGLDELVQYTMESSDLIEELLSASFSDPIEQHRDNIDQLISQMSRIEELVDPTREVQPQREVQTREQMIQFIRESEREGTELPISYDPRLGAGGRFRSEELGQIVGTEKAREELQPFIPQQQLQQLRREEPFEERQPQQQPRREEPFEERQLIQQQGRGRTETREALDINLNIKIESTTGGTAETFAEDIISSPEFRSKMEEYFLRFSGVSE